MGSKLAITSRTRQDSGFTLTELLVVLAILGTVTTVIALTFSVIVRTAPTTEARADDARALLNLTRWLPGDVASTEPGSLSTDETDAVCAAPAGTSALLVLSWDQGLSRNHVEYRWVPSTVSANGNQLGSIRRYSCRSVTSPVNDFGMSDEISEIGGTAPVDVFLIDDTDGVAVGAQFLVRVLDEASNTTRDILDLEMLSRNVADDPIGDSDGSSGGFPPTNVAPIASTLITHSNEAQMITVNLPVFDFDGTNEVLVVSATSADGWLVTPDFPADPPTLEIDIPAGTALGTGAYTEYIIDYTVTDRLGQTENGALSDSGQVLVRVMTDPLAELPVDEILFPPPPAPACDASIVDISPPAPRLKRNNRNPASEVGPLDTGIDIVVARNQYCGPLFIEFDPGAPDATSTFSESVRNNDTATLRNNAEDWVIGARPLRLVERPIDSAQVVHDSGTVTIRRFGE